jgi:hypothetical protein
MALTSTKPIDTIIDTTIDTIIDTTSVELTDTQLGLIEHLRKELKVNDTTKVVLKHIEESFLRVSKGVLDGVLSAEERESILAAD